MNFFDLFEIPVSFSIDKDLLRKRYYALNRENHPDNFTLLSELDQSSALEKSSNINEGFRLLNDDLLRMKYVLELTGIKFEEGKESVPQDFLLEMMEVNEFVFNYKMDPSEESKKMILNTLNNIHSKIFEKVSEFMYNFDFNSPNPECLESIKKYFLKRNYLKRIENNFYN